VNFVAIDFETANEKRSSPCAIGIAVVERGKIIKRRSWLIRPPECSAYFNPFNVAIHGITASDVLDEPEFPEVWECVYAYCRSVPLLAHNAAFDISVLRQTLDVYSIPYPDAVYNCSMNIARKTWPGLPSYGLDCVAGSLGIAFEHHDAAEDAYACAELCIRACDMAKATSIVELSDRLGIKHGVLYPGGYKPTSIKKPRKPGKSPKKALSGRI
jgi:DNA polymerase III subunit epsilon